MQNQLTFPEPVIKVINNQLFTSSLDIAENFGKRHDNVIQAIKRLDIPKDFSALNFKAAEYLDEQGKPRLYYNITRDGFVLLVMGFTGKEAMQWKIRYIQAFNAMEAQLLQNMQQPLLDTPSTVESRKDLNALVHTWLKHSNLQYQEAYRMLNMHMGVKSVEELTESQLAQACAFVNDCIIKSSVRVPLPDSERLEAAKMEHWRANGKYVMATGHWPESSGMINDEFIPAMAQIISMAARAEDLMVQYHEGMAAIMSAKATLASLQKMLPR